MENAYNWIVANWKDIVTVWTAIVTISSIIVKLVPTLKKGTLGKAVIKAIAIYGALNR
jgi:hypothetical protein